MKPASYDLLELSDIEKNLVKHIHLEPIHARVFLLVTTTGKMSVSDISSRLDMPLEDAVLTCRHLVKQGGFIDMSETEFEAMHPRFTVVNMYKRMCESRDIKFGRNDTVDGMGAFLEKYYDDARTK